MSENEKLIIHRALTLCHNDKHFHWLKLCNHEQTFYGQDLTWDNEEVTCTTCLNILKDSNLIKNNEENI